MAVFGILDYEPVVQINDKTRYIASKSFNAKDSLPINSVLIKPNDSTTAIQVFEDDKDNWYLDYLQEDFKYDIVAENQNFIFSESPNVNLTAQIATGSYTLAQLITALVSALNTAGDLTYSGSVDSSNVVTLSATGSFSLGWSLIQDALMLPINETRSSFIGDPVEYCIINITVTVTNGTDSDEKTYLQKCYSVAGDNLPCDSGDIVSHEPDVLKWVPEGRSTHKNVFRRSQSIILKWLDEKGYVNVYGVPYKKKDIVDIEEIRNWATYISLRLIFESNSNAVDDIFSEKAKKYSLLEESARQRAILRVDTDKDGIVDATEGLDISSGTLWRR